MPSTRRVLYTCLVLALFAATAAAQSSELPPPLGDTSSWKAYGVGVTMTLGCDVRIAARSAPSASTRAL